MDGNECCVLEGIRVPRSHPLPDRRAHLRIVDELTGLVDMFRPWTKLLISIFTVQDRPSSSSSSIEAIWFEEWPASYPVLRFPRAASQFK
jgi:hypothetical protein